MTVNMLSIVCVFHSFFTFFIESALACRLFCVLCHFIYRFSSFSLLKSTVSQLQSSSSFMFLLGGFFILWTSDFRGLFRFRYICYCFLFSCFGPFAKMFSYYRVLIFARGWKVLFWKLEAARFAHLFRLCSLQSAIFGGRPLLFIFLLLSLLAFLPFSLLFYVPGFALLSTQCAWTPQSSSVRICLTDFLVRSKCYYRYLNSSFLLLMSSSSSWCSWWRFCMCALLLFFIFSNSSLISPLHVIFKNEIINHFQKLSLSKRG